MTLAMTTAMAVLDVAETGEPAPPRLQVVPERQRVGADGRCASRPVRARPPAPGPVRLTRRGRVVVGGLAIAAAAAVACLLSLALASGALASSHGPAGAGYQGMRQVVVQPGQTLWSIAATAAPSADPRVVIPQIEEANSLSGSTVYPGETLWVPGG
ncbi:MAG TPA: LysM peptidoglycan-binding domain-containing protein [Streptosporangiaceae bacterium]|nr:LysM peptidoglycan-binding domain-containing protein [Streptosporangiaceae bacterium]